MNKSIEAEKTEICDEAEIWAIFLSSIYSSTNASVISKNL